MAGQQVTSLDAPDQVLDMERGRFDIVHIAGGGVGRATFQPGWKWSEHEKPVVGGGDYCEAPHFLYVATGRLHVVMSDGDEVELKAGDIATIPAGHDGWVVGDEPVTMIDFGGVAKPF
ncbi:MAG: cupin domain-containing protein [Dehalococcoidia bacterium]|nr:MAG: cupin domain-containing protein [Dehalococcoidia bacterium]